MKQYTSSIGMGDDPVLVALLGEAIRANGTTHVIETGTYDGRGSTSFVAQSFDPDYPPRLFVTMEVNWSSWKRARQYLSRFPWVMCLWGRSVARDRALAFVRGDPVLRDHERYPHLFVDDTENPVGFYSREVEGKLGGRRRDHPLRWLVDRALRYSGDDLLRRWLIRFRRCSPLVVLDSAGGLGYLEFMTLIETMGENPYLLLMDDVNHVKHFRSLAQVRAQREFTILGLDEEKGWALAKREATVDR